MMKRATRAIRRFLQKYLRALGGSVFLFTAGVAFRRHRFLIFQIAEHFGFKLPAEDKRIPLLPLSSVLDTRLDLMLLEPMEQAGNVSLLETLVISSLVRRANPPTAFEIGTFDGRTTLNIAANLPAGGQVRTLDLPKAAANQTKFELAPGESAFVEKEMSGERFRGTDYASRIEQLYGDSATFDFTPYHGQNGLVFVDGSHAFDYVMQDSRKALELASVRGAMILWHDYHHDWPDVVRALNSLHESGQPFSKLRHIQGTALVMLQT